MSAEVKAAAQARYPLDGTAPDEVFALRVAFAEGWAARPTRVTRAQVEQVAQQMHLAVEDELIEMRDARISVIGPANGFVVREKDGTPSGIMRLGTRDGMRIGLLAALKALEIEVEDA